MDFSTYSEEELTRLVDSPTAMAKLDMGDIFNLLKEIRTRNLSTLRDRLE